MEPSITVGGSRVYKEFYTQEELDRVDTLLNGATPGNMIGSPTRDDRQFIFFRPSLYATHKFNVLPDRVKIEFIPVDRWGVPSTKLTTPDQEQELYDIANMTLQKLNLPQGLYYGSMAFILYDIADLIAYQRYDPDYFVSPHYDRMTYTHDGITETEVKPLTFLVMLSEKHWNGGDFKIDENAVTTVDFQRNVGIMLNKALHSVDRITEIPGAIPVPGVKRLIMSFFLRGVTDRY